MGHSEDLETVVELAQEAAQVAEEYSQVRTRLWAAVDGYFQDSIWCLVLRQYLEH